MIAFHLQHYILIHNLLIVAEFSCHLCNHVFYHCVNISLFGLYLDPDNFTPDFPKINFSLILSFCSVGLPENDLFRCLTIFYTCHALVSCLPYVLHVTPTSSLIHLPCNMWWRVPIMNLDNMQFFHHAFSSSIRCSVYNALLPAIAYTGILQFMQ